MVGKEKSEEKTTSNRTRSPGRPKKSDQQKSPPRPKSPARNKSPSRPKSSARPRSPPKSKSPARTKSPARPKSPPKSKSPARTKSPVRTKSPPKSRIPARTRSPPSRQSPGRTSPAHTKVEAKIRPVTPNRTKGRSPIRGRLSPATSTPILSLRSPITRSERIVKQFDSDKDIIKVLDVRSRKETVVIDTDTDSDTAEIIPEVPEKPKATVRGRTRRVDVEIEKDGKVFPKENYEGDVGTIGLMQRYLRSSQTREEDRVVHLKHFDSVTVTKRLGEFSDEDVLQEKKSSDVKEVQKIRLTEFGGTFGALFLIFAIPMSIVGLHVVCNNTQCRFTSTPTFKKFTALSEILDPKSLLGIVAFIITLAILSALPFGGKKISALPSKHGKFVYIMNGLLSFFFISTSVLALEYYGIKVAEYIVDHIFHLLISSISLGLIISCFAYIRSFYVPVSALNLHAVGRNGIYAFFMGRELNPRIFAIIDLKLLFFRAFVVGSILLDFAFLYKSITVEWPDDSEETFLNLKQLNVNPTLLIYVCLHTIYYMDILVFESTWITTFTSQEEGFGYLLGMLFCVAPFANVLNIRYILDHKVHLAVWKLALVTVVFLFGYILYRASNNQKDAFRKNPYSPSLSHLETIPTTLGKKLLVSGFWGISRHPNYLGDIIIQLCWVPFVLWNPPTLTVVFSIVFLIQRAIRDNARCKQKYGSAWDRYCTRVKYVLIPKVY